MGKTVLAGVLVLGAACGSAKAITEPPTPVPATVATAGLNTPVLAPAPTTTEVATTDEPPSTPAVTTTEYLQPVATTLPLPAPTSSSSALASIRACESGSNYTTDTGNGYYGAYQFSLSTWASVGGAGNPAYASPSEQDMRAQAMIDAGRRGEWPNC